MINAALPQPIITLATPFLYIPIQEESDTVIRNYGNVGPANFLLVNATGRAWDNEPKYSINRLYQVGNFVRPTVANSRRYECTAITSGLSHLTVDSSGSWTTTIGATVVDNGVTWTCRALETGNGAVHGSGFDITTGIDTIADYIHANDAQYDVAGNGLFDLCNFWRDADGSNTGHRLLVRFRCRTHAMYDQDEQRIPNSAYQLSGAVVAFGAQESAQWTLTINSDTLYTGLNYVDSVYNPNPLILGYGTSGVAHQDYSGGLLTCDNGWHEAAIFFDPIDGDVRSWIDGQEATIDPVAKSRLISSIRGYAVDGTFGAFYFSESGNFQNGLTLMSRNKSFVPGTRTASDIATGATSATCHEFLMIKVRNPSALDAVVSDLYRFPKCSLPLTLKEL